MKHQGMEVYKIYINHDPGMTLTYFTVRSAKVAHTFEWGGGELLKCHLKDKTCSKLINRLIFYKLKKTLTPGVILTLPWGYIHVYYHSSQTSLSAISLALSSFFFYIYLSSQVSVYRTIGPLVCFAICKNSVYT